MHNEYNIAIEWFTSLYIIMTKDVFFKLFKIIQIMYTFTFRFNCYFWKKCLSFMFIMIILY